MVSVHDQINGQQASIKFCQCPLDEGLNGLSNTSPCIGISTIASKHVVTLYYYNAILFI